MIGSFWNLCRACPSMPVDKLHSEYRSTYRWHEYTGPRQEVVRRPPGFTERVHDIQPTVTSNKGHENEFNSDSVTKMEPAMPRRKKYPDLAHRHHDFILGNDGGSSFDNVDSRARSEERGGSQWRPSRRSKSEGPARCGVSENGIRERERERRRDSDPDVDIMGRSAGGDSGLLRKAISKISTEYRLQFAWPQGGHTSRRDAADSAPRKSQSMGALKANANAAMVHKKRIDMENKDASELEPLVNDKHDKSKDELFKTEYKKKFRPFSQYEYTNGHFTKRIPDEIVEVTKEKEVVNGEKDSWYREVVELRQKAGEYRNRGWGSKLGPEKITDMYNKQVELWDQVSRRSSLSALSLASTTHKNYTKEEKEEDNHKKSSPSKAYRNSENSARMIRDIIRHHLERTTGGSEKDGLILSPTREKLEPTIPRKDDDSRGSQKNSPKKNSPIKSSSLKRTNQKSGKAGPKKLRSQSVGPVTDSNIDKRSSPKRQSRSATVKERGSKPASQSVSATRKTRPSSLNTTVSSRSKNSSVKPEDDRSAKSQKGTIGSANQKQIQKGNHGAADRKVDSNAAKNGINDEEYDSLTYEPVVKSPPEPTRVKSPEQIIMRSPDPVNWTVPLDTGKTFTVTQNVKEGEIGSRPHSEVKAWTPPDVPPPVAQSAPPSLTDQNKEQGLDLAVKA